jgi:hypothetical protein
MGWGCIGPDGATSGPLGLLRWRFPNALEQRIQLLICHARHSCEDIGQVGLGVDASPSAALDNRVNVTHLFGNRPAESPK